MADAPHLCLLGDANSPHTRRWALEMRARGWRVSLVTARPEPLDGVGQRILAPVQRQTDWLLRTSAAQRAVRELAPDIVHAHYLTSYGYLAARCDRHPLVMTAWGSDLLVTPHTRPWMRWLTGWILRRADLLTGDSASLVEAARQYQPRAPVHEIHWGVDRTRFTPAPWEHKDNLHIVSLRAWEPNYQIATLIDAFALARQQLPGVPLQLHLLGGGSLEPTLRAQVQELGLAPSVTFHGRLDDAGMAAVLARCKISVTVPASDARLSSGVGSMKASSTISQPPRAASSSAAASKAGRDCGCAVGLFGLHSRTYGVAASKARLSGASRSRRRRCPARCQACGCSLYTGPRQATLARGSNEGKV